MKKRLLSLFLAMTTAFSCLVIPAYAGKGDDGPFIYTETGVYERIVEDWGAYNNRVGTVSVTLPASETGIEFSYLAVLDDTEYGNGPEMTPLPSGSGWSVDYLFTYCTVDLDSAGIPLTPAMAIPIGMEPAAWTGEYDPYAVCRFHQSRHRPHGRA